MARKTFISYKYSDVVENKTNNLRDRIIAKFGEDAKFYRGEDGYTKDLSSYSAAYIKETLKKMIRDTSVTILILSPNMKLSQWMNWELSYSLSEITRNGRISHSNGVIAVVQKRETYGFGSGYDWFMSWNGGWDMNKTFELVRDNQGNKKLYAPDSFSSNYIDIVSEDTFLRDPNKYIEEAYEKSQYINYYNVRKQGGIW